MDLINLPTDPSDLQRLVLRQAAALARSRAALAEVEADKARVEADKARVEADKANLEAELKDVKARMDALIRRVFGRRSERLPANQIQLFDPTVLPEVEAAVDTDQTDDKPTPKPAGPRRRKKRTGGRRALPAHLERIEVTSAETGPTECEECGGNLKVIGEDRSERLDYVPAKVRVVVSVRQKRACPCCPARGVHMQPAPTFALAKALCGDSLLAKVLTDKYADHIPLNRQSKRFKREAGVDIAVSTMCGWVRASADLLGRVVDVMANELRSGAFIQSDATGLPILEGTKNNPRRGHLWSYTDGTQVVMKASLDGRQAHPAGFLNGFQGTLLTDGASAYNAASQRNGVVRAGCWAHARRKFFEARKEDPVRAGIALATIRKLFRVEREVQPLTSEVRAQTRRHRLAASLARFRDQLNQWSTTCRPKSAMGKAITYARNPQPTAHARCLPR